MAAVIPIQSTRALVAIGIGYFTFGSMLTVLLFFLDFADADKDVKYSQDHAQYWLGIPALILGLIVLFSGSEISTKSKYIRLCLSVFCFVMSIVCIALEAPDWMRYLSDNRSPDDFCKLAMIAVPGLQEEMQNSKYDCSRRTSYAWSVGFVMVSAVLLINFSVCSILLHAWLAVKDQMTYKMPDYPAFMATNDNVEKDAMSKIEGTSNKGFVEN